MSRLLLSLFAAVLLVASLPADAQRLRNLEDRVVDARDRVHRGFRNGDLTRNESDRLHVDIDRVERMMREARRDGVATKGERQDLRDEMSRVERDIDRLITNRRRR
jgi:hypothetical protein